MKSFLSPIKEIIEDLSVGRMVVIVDDENRENEGDLIFCGSFVSSEKINFMAKYARGLICLALDKKRFKKLNLKNIILSLTGLQPLISIQWLH